MSALEYVHSLEGHEFDYAGRFLEWWEEGGREPNLAHFEDVTVDRARIIRREIRTRVARRFPTAAER